LKKLRKNKIKETKKHTPRENRDRTRLCTCSLLERKKISKIFYIYYKKKAKVD